MRRYLVLLLLLVLSFGSAHGSEIGEMTNSQLLGTLKQNEQSILDKALSLRKDYNNLSILYSNALQTLGSSDSYTLSLETQLTKLEEELNLSEMTVSALESRSMKIYELSQNLNEENQSLKKTRWLWFGGGVLTILIIEGVVYYVTDR